MSINISGNFSQFIAALEAKRKISSDIEQIAQQARQMGVQSIQSNLWPGHGFDTGNMSKGYERASKVEMLDGKAVITWTSDAPYQPFQEVKSPHLVIGIHQVWPQIVELAKNWNKL